jgi:hypothetical protein
MPFDGNPLGMAKALPLLKATAHSAAAPTSEYLRFFFIGCPLAVITRRTIFIAFGFTGRLAATVNFQ